MRIEGEYNPYSIDVYEISLNNILWIHSQAQPSGGQQLYTDPTNIIFISWLSVKIIACNNQIHMVDILTIICKTVK